MENLENDIMTTEAVEAVTDSVSADAKGGLSTAAVIGCIGALSIAGWELAIKPLARKAKTLIVKGKEKLTARKQKKEEDAGEKALENIPEIDE